MLNQEKLNLQDEESNLSEFSCEERSLKTEIETLTAKQESAVFKITSNEKNADKTKQKMGGMKNTDGKVKKDEHICFKWQKEMRVKWKQLPWMPRGFYSSEIFHFPFPKTCNVSLQYMAFDQSMNFR